MNNTPFTEKTWDQIPHHVDSFRRAMLMREACREMERQRNDLLEALEGWGFLGEFADEEIIVVTTTGFNVRMTREAISKAKGEAP